MNWHQKFYRVERGAKLAGVCGGLAECLNIDPTLVRLGWIALTLCSVGLWSMIYLAAAVLLPRKSQVYPPL